MRKTNILAPDDAVSGGQDSNPASPNTRRSSFAGSRQGSAKSGSARLTLTPTGAARASFRRSAKGGRKRRNAGPGGGEEDVDQELDDAPSDSGAGRGHKVPFLADYLAMRKASKDPHAEDLLPGWCRRYALRQHVMEMMRSYPERLRKFVELKKELDVELDMRKMGMTIRDFRLEALKKPPRSIELSRMPVLYAETYDAYRAGRYKDVQHDHVRKLRKVWTVWYRVYRQASGGNLASPRGQSRTSPSGKGSSTESPEGRSILSSDFNSDQRKRTLLRSLQRQLDEFAA